MKISGTSSDAQFTRTVSLIGKNAVDFLAKKKVAVFGVGGVGSYVVEALSRAGIGQLLIVDKDTFDETNINRQLGALHSTVGKSKVQVTKQRILDINPHAIVDAREAFYLPETADSIDFSSYDYIVDAVDTVTAKLLIIQKAKQLGIPVISSMGTGNKLDPTRFKVADIHQTSVCPLARIMRQELKKRGIDSLKVVYSDEIPVIKSQTPASISFVPSVAGLIIASEVIRDLLAPCD